MGFSGPLGRQLTPFVIQNSGYVQIHSPSIGRMRAGKFIGCFLAAVPPFTQRGDLDAVLVFAGCGRWLRNSTAVGLNFAWWQGEQLVQVPAAQPFMQ